MTCIYFLYYCIYCVHYYAEVEIQNTQQYRVHAVEIKVYLFNATKHLCIYFSYLTVCRFSKLKSDLIAVANFICIITQYVSRALLFIYFQVYGSIRG